MPLGAAESGMVYVPGGEFLRGRSHPLPDDDMERRSTLLKDDRPARTIHVEPFYLDEHEVTNEAYRRFLEATGQQPPFHWVDGEIAEGEEKHPVVNVNWHEAAAYCESCGETPSDRGRMGAGGARAGRGGEVSMGKRGADQGPAGAFRCARRHPGRLPVSEEYLRTVRHGGKRVGVVC